MNKPVQADAAPAPEQVSWGSRGRIVMVIRLLAGRSGGAERLFCEMANMFAAERYEVTALYCDSSSAEPFYPLSPKVARVNLYGKLARNAPWYKALDGLAKNYKKGLLRAPVDWLARNLYFTRRLYAVAREAQPDVIISFMPPSNTPSLIAGWLAGARVIPTNHNVPEQDYRSPERWDQNPIDRFLRLRTLRAAARVHVIFPGFAGWFPEHLQKKIVSIPNYVSPEFLDHPWQPERRKEILGVGRLTAVKNYMALVEAWAMIADRHPDWTVKIYGIGPQKKQLAARIRDLGLDGVVQLMGHEPDMKRVYAQAEILCHPAVHEGFGLSVAEAQACGLPVVAFSDCEGVKEFVRGGDNGLMVDRERGAAALAEALERLITDAPLRERIRRRGAESIREYSLDAFKARWTAMVDEVIAEARA